MKLLLTHRYFYPDTAPYATMLRSIGDHLAQSGHEVSIFASKPSYRKTETQKVERSERLNDLHVKRVWVFQENRKNPLTRIANVAIYCLGLFFHILRLRPDVVSAATFPPILAAWFASLAARIVGAKFIYHCQDIAPEVSMYSGGRMGRGALFKLFRWLDNQTLRRSGAIVVLSEDMANTLKQRGIPDLPIHIINNFLLENFETETPAPKEYQKSAGRIRAIFAGNLGRFQNLPLLADGISGCFDANPDLELMFLGDGAALPELQAKWGGHPQVTFAPFLPFAQAQTLIADADIGLVSLQEDIFRVAYPSKMLSYLGLGLPIFAMLEPESELSKTIQMNALGGSGNGDEITANFAHLLENLPSRSHVESFYKETFTTDIIFEKWDAVISKC